ncbi:hypothetical protein GCM10011584_09530 [Nocardioides phosphati]|uniref:Helix-turn-helix domain-containing protein n=1 Tax=Nocardioides phosphati TaxID=1867775 RepID=A0ABQ2NC74_9ACTN|nr:hypothetical protein [Nocardioides phosphati]GGO86667.1 hypothetical protein GCM10011584_09530 [Nocardioides phosphati]
MARDHARIYVSIWDNPDFIRLPSAAQHAYLMLGSQKGVSYCGVVDYVPGRMLRNATDLTEPKLRAAVKTLARDKFVVVDQGTQELLIRSFIRHDNILARKNMGIACAKAIGKVHSQDVRDALMHELARLYAEDPSREGWAGFKSHDPIAFDMACAMALDME